MLFGEAPFAHADRWALMHVLVDLRVRVIVHTEWPRHARLAAWELEEAGSSAFAVGMRWAELEGRHLLFRQQRSGDWHIPLPQLIGDLPVLADSFSEGYRTVAGGMADEALIPAEEHLLLSVCQVAKYLDRPEHDVLMRMNEGALACQWYGGERRVSFQDLEAYRLRHRDDEEQAFEALLAVAEMIEQRSSFRAA